MTTGDPAGGFRDRGYHVVRQLLPHPACAFLHDYGVKSARAGLLKTDGAQVPGTPSAYADPLMEALLEVLAPRIESETGLALHPTYSFFRVYRREDRLRRHHDREACEVSVTVNLGGDVVWPIWIEPATGPVEVRLLPGDGLIYRGIQVPHWREAYEGDDAVQAFLHYVDQRGPHREWIFDKRAQLAASAAARQLVQRLVARG